MYSDKILDKYYVGWSENRGTVIMSCILIEKLQKLVTK